VAAGEPNETIAAMSSRQIPGVRSKRAESPGGRRDVGNGSLHVDLAGRVHRGPNERLDNGLGDGGGRLHEWLPDAGEIGRPSGVNGRVVDEFMSTCAVVAGRGRFEPAGGWDDDHHDGVPIFILTRQDPAHFTHWPLVSCVNDVTTAMTQATEAVGNKNVADPRCRHQQLAPAADALDEIELHVIPVIFGQGRRLFDGLAAEQIELERTRILEGENGVTHMHYRVQR
jgi:dihydrofolate reductase